MESPLILAHRQAKKAEQQSRNCQKMEEASANHKSAAENILLAMEMSTSMHARESLHLQHNYHMTQSDLLHQRHCAAQDANRKNGDGKNKSRNKNTDRLNCTQPSSLTTDGGLLESDVLDGDVLEGEEYDSAYKSLGATDTLLQFLHNRSPDTLTVKNLNKYCNDNKAQCIKTAIENATKQPKNKSMVIEELRIHNEALQSHIKMLIGELEKSRGQTANLQQTIDTRETNNTLLVDNTNPIPGIELPPLEMPNFDFQSLTSELDNCVDNVE